MTTELPPQTTQAGPAVQETEWKRIAGEAAALCVEDGMAVGLGTGSTAYWAIAAIGRRLQRGELRDVTAVATSERSARQAIDLAIPLLTLAEQPRLDLAIDGADEVGPNLGLIKGGGGALVREKIVAGLAERFLVVADERKCVARLGRSFALPVAVVPFGWPAAQQLLESLGASVRLRTQERDQPWLSDDGLFILDADFPDGIDDPEVLEVRLELDPAIVCCGLFLDLAKQAFIGGDQGLEVLTPSPSD
jgi:ribose 5-phosphate isomerase A